MLLDWKAKLMIGIVQSKLRIPDFGHLTRIRRIHLIIYEKNRQTPDAKLRIRIAIPDIFMLSVTSPHSKII